jgi:succinate dehydrogenase / fumarate reductase flavoprotein subunit
VAERSQALLSIKGKKTPTSFHRELGKLMWDTAAWAATSRRPEEGPGAIPELREEFWKNVKVPGTGEELNQSLERPAAWPTSSSWAS